MYGVCWYMQQVAVRGVADLCMVFVGTYHRWLSAVWLVNVWCLLVHAAGGCQWCGWLVYGVAGTYHRWLSAVSGVVG